MEFFDRLGESVYRAWHARNFDAGVFDEIAVAALREAKPSDHVTPEDIVAWVHESPQLPAQGDLDNPFGSPPVVLYRGPGFYIEALFWVDSTTSIHQHGFSGAFHVLEGSSIHSEYGFHQEHRYSDHLLLGRLELKSVEHLRKGDVRAIRSGQALVHSLFHLDRPSISIVVRTGGRRGGPQYSYLRSGIAYDPDHLTDSCVRKRQTLELLRTLGRPIHDRALRTLQASDASTALHLLFWLDRVTSDDEHARLLEGLGSTHAPLVQRMKAQREENAREVEIIGRRSRITSAEHRFLLALLLNVPSRPRILEMVASAYPTAPPVETVVRWVYELAGMRLDDGRNALDIELPESAQRIFEHLANGASDEQVIGRLREEYEVAEDEIQLVGEVCQAFRRSLVFRSLFQD